MGEWFGVLGYVLGCLSRLISARLTRWWDGWDFRVPLLLVFLPGLPILGLRGREVPWARSWSNGFRWRSCCSLCRFACRSRLSGWDAVSVDRLVSCFPMCGCCVSVGGLRTANVLPVFALVVSVGLVAVFLTASDPSDTALAWSVAAVAAIAHGSSFSLLARGSLWPLEVVEAAAALLGPLAVLGGQLASQAWVAEGCGDGFCPPSFRYLWNVAAVSPLFGECCCLISTCS